MKLRGTEFGHVFCAAGARNFFGREEDAYWFHRLWIFRAFYWIVSALLGRPWGLNYAGSTFVSKTTTFASRAGNMRMKPHSIVPRDRFPSCVRVNFFGGYALNKVGLTGPGAYWLIEQRIWQKHVEPFVISFMAVSSEKEDRLEELRRFVRTLNCTFLDDALRARVALEINLSCPNVGLDQSHLVEEAREMREIFEVLGIPVGFKLSVDIDPTIASSIAEEGSFLTATNTVGFGKLPDRIDWKALFGSDTSPLADVGAPGSGGGGLSGRPLLPLVIEWIREVRSLGVKIPIIGGGGILSEQDAMRVLDAGASAVFLGCVSMLRPWRVASIIRKVNGVLS